MDKEVTTTVEEKKDHPLVASALNSLNGLGVIALDNWHVRVDDDKTGEGSQLCDYKPSRDTIYCLPGLF